MVHRKPREIPEYIIKDIDSEILPAVMELNKRGLYTEESCAGHHGTITDKKGKVWENPGFGYLVMTDIPSKKEAEEIRTVLENHGIHNIRIRTTSNKFPTVRFDSGGKRYTYDERIRKWKDRFWKEG
jgi:hypothetical protein